VKKESFGDFSLPVAKPLCLNLSIFWQGCAKMTSRIGGSVAGGNWKYAHGTAHYGRNFSVKWLKVQKLFH
jgi:cleavage and polyadenylation specificity factor subunit 4